MASCSLRSVAAFRKAATRREALKVLSVAASLLSVSELSSQARHVCTWVTVESHNLIMREFVDLTGLADLLDLTRREANELACEENFPAPVDVVQGSQNLVRR